MLIEKNVPMPPKKHRNRLYPWQEMEVGDSFVIQGRTAVSVTGTCASATQRYKPKKFKCAEVENGVRIWRVE